MTQAGRSEDDRIIDFALRWLPYGGGPAEDIVVGFGISPREFFARLDTLLRGPARPPHLDRAAVAALLRMCSRRLRMNEDIA
ncbi:hypothetical protein DK926_24250 [Rhodococcus sp. Eu-32]|uniref:hypothetical protein n=1 Tax=Rhodococcus sp. Eu-32 TaxID=1017319 RepID=UPI000DF1D53C|nr:hypothetical protein [Rhodococcus sp. Eu-32]RRQ25292.1 hypothetical protein DK926_24250 [Rhodococcus sp. Eu-32]